MSQHINTKSIARIAAIQTFYDFYNSQKHGEYTEESQNNMYIIDDVELNNARLMSSLMRIVEYYKDKDSKEDMLSELDKDTKIKPSYKFLKELVTFTEQDMAAIDVLIENNLAEGWKMKDLSVLLLAVLKVAICELKFYPETAKKIIISEYTDIANSLLDDNEIGFVNSILENCASIIRA